jgi:hypothetical protein
MSLLSDFTFILEKKYFIKRKIKYLFVINLFFSIDVNVKKYIKSKQFCNLIDKNLVHISLKLCVGM